MKDILARAVTDVRAYVEGGVDGLIVENEGDIPFLKPEEVGAETVAALTAAALAVRDAADVSVGIDCLANAVTQSLAVAKAVGRDFRQGQPMGERLRSQRRLGRRRGRASTAL